MGLFKELSSVLPYIQSIRKLESYMTFDLNIPKNWKLPKKYVVEDKILELESTIQNFRLISFISEMNEESVEITINNVKNIIKYNLELEEKDKLFQQKVEELKTIFLKQNLKNLKGLQFEIKEINVKLQDHEEEVPTLRMVSDGSQEG